MKKIHTTILLFLSLLYYGQSSDLSGVNENYIYTRTYLEPKTSSDPNAKQIQSISFFDGLGKPRQDIVIHGSPTGNDLVTHIPYDNFGRQVEDWLAIPMSSLNGNIQTPPSTSGSYKTSSGSVDGLIYGKKNLENSPLDRLLSYTGPGSDWQGKKVSNDYSINSKFEVYKYSTTTSWNNGATSSVLNTQPDSYPAGSLYKTVVSDEDGHQVTEYKNQRGQSLLVRKNDGVNNLDTYYVYNEYNQLAFIIPPLAANKVVTPVMMDELIYQYHYDGWNRLVEAKLPGKGWEYSVYDKQDRLVGTQDANLRGKGQWLYTKYDQFSRVIMTGICQAMGNSRLEEQNYANTKGNNSETRSSSISMNYSGMDIYYSVTQGYPKYDKVYNFLSLNYYDTYPIGSPATPSQIQGSEVLQDNTQNSAISTKGLPTASYIKNTEANDIGWTKNYYYYDTKGRSNGSYSINHLGGYTRTESNLAFSGAPLSTFTRHKREANSIEITIGESFTYDPQQRLIKHTHRVNGAAEETLAEYTYNELGQLQNKNVGNGIQSLAYQYNTRGELTHINDPKNLNNKLFGFELKYTNPQNAAGLYNGNIAEIDWATRTDGVLRRYVHQYDTVNRLVSASYQKPNTTVITTNAYNESVTYDLNGNIKTLLRFGGSDSNSAVKIDDIKYTYQGNLLVDVRDSSGNYSGLEGGGEMGYDVNGNMIEDGAHFLENIAYNHLNLPQLIEKKYDYFEYLYSANGTKLRSFQNITEINKIVVTDYLDGFQYQNGILEFVPTSEGYYDFVKNKYIYNYTDHLGNIRVSYRKGDSGSAEIIEENNYYPFGLKHQGYNSNGLKNLDYKYGFLGNELQETGMYDMNARFYMPDLGRFSQHDPLSSLSADPYGYAFNNPVSFRDPTGLFGEGPKCPPDCSISPYSPGGANNPLPIQEVVIPAPGNPGGGYNGPAGSYGNYPMGGYGYGDYSGGASSNSSGYGNGGNNTNSPGPNSLAWMGIRNMDNFQASESILTSAIENTKVGQSVSAAENFMFLELPAQFAGGALLSAGWRAAGAGKFLSGVANNLYAKIAPGFIGNLAEKTTFSVYHGFDVAGKLRYIGITSRDPAIRWAEHAAAGGEKGLLRFDIMNGATGLTKAEARVIEQNFINQYGLQRNGGVLLNKINSIAPNNWKNFSGIIPSSGY
ncbi:DUF6443 domain-containing protein [Chryseobacterium rhizosphaerae]|uniref:DUF6443 domain-containing protein n=1 Tax=Chryseobacterium rhizosphaerae TaxID=395937 RepID=UPI00235A0BB3|nr:DUF6443 domain-containing protein [Chryseobacterium rhizosphaerae]MDC8098668.1 RHS repeat-associated core domain-containing protein [Chryseobacterium rhizosphaerae]